MKIPTLSVIMGNYNHAHYLVDSIPAILNQSFHPKEIIIIDDASTDNSVEIIEGFAKKDPIIRFYKNEKNLGNKATYLKAYELITGDYFNFAAADDLVLPGLFEKTMAMLAKYPNAGVCSAITRKVNEKGDELGEAPERPYVSKTPRYFSPKETLEYFMKGEGAWCCVGNAAVWRQSAVIESGGFPRGAGLFTDEFLAILLGINFGVCFIPEPLALHRVLPGSMGSRYREDPEAISERIEPIVKLMRTSYKNKFPESYIEEYQRLKRYEQGAMALQRWQESMAECNIFLGNSLKNSSFDKWILKGNKILGGAHHRFLKLYLYARLRKFNWLMIRRVFLRLMKKFKTKQE